VDVADFKTISIKLWVVFKQMQNLFCKIAKHCSTPLPLFTKLSSQTGHESCNAVRSDSYNCPIITLRHVYDNLIVARLGKRAITCRPMECGVQRTEKTGKNNNKKLKCN